MSVPAHPAWAIFLPLKVVANWTSSFCKEYLKETVPSWTPFFNLYSKLYDLSLISNPVNFFINSETESTILKVIPLLSII